MIFWIKLKKNDKMNKENTKKYIQKLKDCIYNNYLSDLSEDIELVEKFI